MPESLGCLPYQVVDLALMLTWTGVFNKVVSVFFLPFSLGSLGHILCSQVMSDCIAVNIYLVDYFVNTSSVRKQ